MISRSSEHTGKIGRRLGELCGSGDWLGLTGELGAGKTRFVQGLARGLGVDPSIPVTSPTFVIHNTYAGRIVLHHLDLYRLDCMEELAEIGYGELLEQEAVVAVEWYQRIPEALPGRGLAIEISLIDEHSRQIEMTALDSRSVELLNQVQSED